MYGGRRPIGDVLYSIYLVVLVLGVVAFLVSDDPGSYGGASAQDPWVLLGASSLTATLIVSAGVRGQVMTFVDLPALLHGGRRRHPIGWSLKGALAGRFGLTAASGAAIAFTVSRPLVDSGAGAARFAIVGGAGAVIVTAGGLALASRSRVARIVGAFVVPAALMIIVLSRSQGGFSPGGVASMAALAVVSAVVAGIGLESVPFHRLEDRATVLHQVLPRIYLMTPADLHLSSRVRADTNFPARSPIDGWIGVIRVVTLVVWLITLVAIAPAEGFGYPVAAGVAAYLLGVDLLSPLRVETLLVDRVPNTFPAGHLTRWLIRAFGTGLGLGITGLLVAGVAGSAAGGIAVAAFGFGLLAAVPTALARELRFAELLINGGPEILGFVIMVRLAGAAVLAAAAVAGVHRWVVAGEAGGLAIVGFAVLIAASASVATIKDRS